MSNCFLTISWSSQCILVPFNILLEIFYKNKNIHFSMNKTICFKIYKSYNKKAYIAILFSLKNLTKSFEASFCWFLLSANIWMCSMWYCFLWLIHELFIALPYLIFSHFAIYENVNFQLMKSLFSLSTTGLRVILNLCCKDNIHFIGFSTNWP